MTIAPRFSGKYRSVIVADPASRVKGDRTVQEIARRSSEPYQGQGIGRRLLKTLLERGRELGCHQGWVGTGLRNAAARRLHAAAGGAEAPEPFVMVEFDLRPEGELSDRESFGSSP
jgi:GNAT superfamily N-acetyltransferase